MEKELMRDIIRGRRSKACLPLNIKHFDEDITLEKLFERDKGTCYLCGILCNWNDHQNINGYRVTGATYPTREHVIALSLGGTHTWDNVKLACFDCNTKKHNKDISDDEGQLQFYI
jgi:5-methylcytosine-specific restriction endonuclease McrA